MSVNKETILKMVGFTADLENELGATMTTTLTSSGDTTKVDVSQDEERKKDFFELYDVFENWNTLFMSQRMLQMVLPYAYVALLETAVVMVFVMTLMFYGSE